MNANPIQEILQMLMGRGAVGAPNEGDQTDYLSGPPNEGDRGDYLSSGDNQTYRGQPDSRRMPPGLNEGDRTDYLSGPDDGASLEAPSEMQTAAVEGMTPGMPLEQLIELITRNNEALRQEGSGPRYTSPGNADSLIKTLQQLRGARPG